METAEISSIKKHDMLDLKKKFKHMLKGSTMAKYLSLAYAIISFWYAYKFMDNLMYAIPLLIGGLLVLWFTTTHLWLNKVNTKATNLKELVDAIERYKNQTLRREKYEMLVMVFWILTLVPVYLDGKDITVFLVVKMLAVFYIFVIIGNSMFAQVKKQLSEMEVLVSKLI